MEKQETEQLKAILSLLDQPAFFAADGQIVYSNPTAQKLLIFAGAAVESILPDASQLDPSQNHIMTAAIAGKPCTVDCKPCAEGMLFQISAAQDTLVIAADYLDIVAGEIRKPLGEMSLALKQISAELLQLEEGTVAAERLERGVIRMMRLASQLNAGSSILTSKMHLVFKRTEIKQWLDMLARQAEDLFSYTSVRFSYTGLKQPFDGVVDAEKLERAIWNLLSNALLRCREGSTICLSAQRSGSRLLLTLSDSGEGIRNEIRSDVFFRAAGRTGLEDGRDGLGFGLAIVRAVAELHGGSVLLSEQKEGGTTAVLNIPVDHLQSETHSTVALVDETGGISRGLLELSDALGPEAFHPLDIS